MSNAPAGDPHEAKPASATTPAGDQAEPPAVPRPSPGLSSLTRKPAGERPRRRRAKAGRGFKSLLRADPRFGIALVVFALLGAGLFALLARVWRVTPDSLPVVRISGLDGLQARALRRNAAAAEAAGDFVAARKGWQAALANNPADVNALRGVLRSVMETIDAKPAQAATIQQALWLLTLGETNRADLSLAVAVLGRLESDDLALSLGDSRAADLDDAAYTALTEASFRQNRTERFGALWQARAAMLDKDPEAALYRAAWLAAWGPSTTLLAARRALDAGAAQADPKLAITAHRLKLWAAGNTLNLEEFRQSLAWLEERHADRLRDQAQLCRLLMSGGKRAEGARLARGLSQPATTAAELIYLAETLSSLGLTDEAAKRLEDSLGTFRSAPAVWITLAKHDIKLARWAELRELATGIRENPDLSALLNGYSRFLTGVADASLRRRGPAAQAFRAAVSSPGWDPALAFDSAALMQTLGFPAEAAGLLRQVQGDFTGQAEFWFTLSSAAYADQNADLLLESATKAYELAKNTRGAVNNYVAALLICRKEPAKALEILLNLRAAAPGDDRLAINQALALLQNGRTDDAAALLKSMNPAALPAAAAASVHYAWAEYHLLGGRLTEARAAYAQVNPSFLFPRQKEWFEAQAAKLESGR